MNGTSQQAMSAPQAALVLMYGASGSANKFYSLERDALIIGKGRGCDLILEAPDISTIHCIISRNADGYVIRDCKSRSGTRLNGARVDENILRDGDLVQIGPFSFKVVLPPQPAAPRRDVPVRLLRLERKRMNLIKLALTLRERLHAERQRPAPVPAAPAPLNQQAQQLQQRLREIEQRGDELDAAERGLASDREALERETEEFRTQMFAKEQELQQRERELEERWRERQFESEQSLAKRREKLEVESKQRRAELEREFQKRLEALDQSKAPAGGRPPSASELEQQFHKRQVELEQQFHERRQELEIEFDQRRESLESSVQQRLAELESRSREQEQELDQLRQDLECQLAERQQQLERDFAERQQQLEQEFAERQQQPARQQGDLERELKRAPAPDLLARLPDLDAEEDLEKTMMLPMIDEVLGRTRDLDAEQEDEAKRLLIRRRELDHYHQHLQRLREEIDQDRQRGAQNSNPGHLENHMEANGTGRMGENTADQAGIAEHLRTQQAALNQLESALKDQGAALSELVAELRQLRGEPAPSQPAADVDELLRENEELRRLLQEQGEVSEGALPAGALPEDPAVRRELDQVRGENEVLQRLLDEKENELRDMRQRDPATVSDMPAVEDVDSYEAELVRDRRQLEAEREKMQHELEQLRIRNQELDEATREVEMELSRERAEMARERIRLDRMREEIQADMERLQRNGGVLDRLSSVQKLREEITEGRKSSHNMPSPIRNGGR